MEDKRVLIADDDPDVRMLVATALRAWGFEPVPVSTGAEAVAVMLAAGAPPRAILDWMMPGLTGVDVCRAIRAVRTTGEPPYLVLLTARVGGDDVVQALEAGADDYVRKPFSLPELRARISRRSRAAAETAPERIAAGSVLGDRWRLAAPLVAGGMGDIWTAHHISLGIEVVVKLLRTEFVRDPVVQARFESEAHAAAQLRSPYIVQVHDYGVTPGGLAYLVMERLRGRTLSDTVVAQGPLSLPALAIVISQVARGLRATHDAGYVHRDVKPDNVFLADLDEDSLRGLPYQAKLLDFGLARRARGAERMTQHGAFVGTIGFCSPEQIAGGETDERSDVWSLGMTALFAAVGHDQSMKVPTMTSVAHTLRGELPVPSALAPHLPPAFDAWFQTACAQRPEDRFGTPLELARALRAFAGAEVVELGARDRFSLAPGPGEGTEGTEPPRRTLVVSDVPALAGLRHDALVRLSSPDSEPPPKASS